MSAARLLLVTLLIAPHLASADCADEFDKSPKKNSNFVQALKCLQSTSGSESGPPVGTVLISMLSPSEFAAVVGDPREFDPSKSRWSLADGRDVSTSKYRIAAVSKTLPDLRGMFLRGMNEGRKDGREDPVGDREPGSYQPDDLKSHSHKLGLGMHGLASGKGQGNLETNKPEVSTRETGGVETRPRNVAVYYYIKIN